MGVNENLGGRKAPEGGGGGLNPQTPDKSSTEHGQRDGIELCPVSGRRVIANLGIN